MIPRRPLRTAVTLLERFAGLIGTRAEQQPARDPARWLADVLDAGIPELAAFVAKREQDRRAVDAALTSPCNEGQTEGQIDRLKRSSAPCTAARTSTRCANASWLLPDRGIKSVPEPPQGVNSNWTWTYATLRDAGIPMGGYAA